MNGPGFFEALGLLDDCALPAAGLLLGVPARWWIDAAGRAHGPGAHEEGAVPVAGSLGEFVRVPRCACAKVVKVAGSTGVEVARFAQLVAPVLVSLEVAGRVSGSPVAVVDFTARAERDMSVLPVSACAVADAVVGGAAGALVSQARERAAVLRMRALEAVQCPHYRAGLRERACWTVAWHGPGLVGRVTRLLGASWAADLGAPATRAALSWWVDAARGVLDGPPPETFTFAQLQGVGVDALVECLPGAQDSGSFLVDAWRSSGRRLLDELPGWLDARSDELAVDDRSAVVALLPRVAAAASEEVREVLLSFAVGSDDVAVVLPFPIALAVTLRTGWSMEVLDSPLDAAELDVLSTLLRDDAFGGDLGGCVRTARLLST